MNRTARDKRPYVPKLEKIEVSQKNIKLKLAAAILFFVVGAATLAVALNTSLSQEPGWQQIQTDSSYADSCAGEFVLMYHLGAGDTSPTQENKALKAFYAEAAEEAWKLFHGSVGYEGIHNLYYINSHPNEVVTLEPGLYRALKQIADSGNRQIFLAPAAEAYKSLFYCQEDIQAEQLDPWKNQDAQAWIGKLSSYSSDPGHISLELTGENSVMLKVSPEYLEFARENEIHTLADFGWMRNAFLADYLADALASNGFTSGYLTSFDGFTRNLMEAEQFSMNLIDHQQGTAAICGKLNYQGPMSLVFLRDYPLSQQDRWLYYSYENGDRVSLHLDSETCLPMTAVPNLVAYSEGSSCGQILLSVCDAYIAPQLDTALLASLAREDIYSIWPEGTNLCYNDPQGDLELAQGNTLHSLVQK